MMVTAGNACEMLGPGPIGGAQQLLESRVNLNWALLLVRWFTVAWSWKSLLQIPFARFLRLSFVDFWQFVPEVDFGSELSGGRQDVLPLHFLQEAANLN